MKRLTKAEAQHLFRRDPRCPPRVKRANPEEQLQVAVAEFLAYAAPDLVWYHCPNGGRRSKAEAGRLKAMGVRPGVFDIPLVLPDGRAAFIELKSDKGVLSADQKTFAGALPSQTPRAVCRSLEDVVSALLTWGVSLRCVQMGRMA